MRTLFTMKNYWIFPSTVSCSAAQSSSEGADSVSTPPLVRRSDLPIYSEIPTHVGKYVEELANPAVLDAIKGVRIEATKLLRSADAVVARCEKFVDTGIAHSYGSYMNAVDFLREEKNSLPRVGAVVGGTLFGYVISFRKGFFKRFLYAVTSGAFVASICYPSEAKVYACKSLQYSKKYAIISYHFMNGVSKDVGGFELPAFPLKLLSSEVQESADKTTKTN